MVDLWYKNAVVYCLDVETFMDGNGDGVGDFRGLEQRLDYLEALGVTVIWLNPFYPSPNRDNGYDISDFYGVDGRLGTLGDAVQVIRAARERGMRVLADLVVNHSSIDHPWFQASRNPASDKRDWYVWSEEKPADITEGIIFPGVQEAVWTQDREAGGWYMHRFYAHQADLNIANPEVRAEILKIIGFWLQAGISGFRVDAVPFLIEYKGLDEEPARDPLLLLSEIRDFLDWREAGAILLAEANVERDKAPSYFGGRGFGPDGGTLDERMNMLFDFPLNQYLWLAFVRGQAGPVAEALRSRPRGGPVQAQWAVFLRNHDELSLDKLTEAERDEAFAALAPEEGMRIYDRGVRRRLAPMLGGDPRRVALAHALLFGLPGTPVMWYGDEIGMGENLDLPERWPVRTPMQWAEGPLAGFSTAAFSEAGGDPVVALATPGTGVGEGQGGAGSGDAGSGGARVTVAAQEHDPASLLSRVREMARRRRGLPEIGWGDWAVIEGLPAAVLGLDYRHEGRRLLVLANVAGRAVTLPDAALPEGALCVLLSSGDGDAGPRRRGKLRLEPYGYRWIRVG